LSALARGSTKQNANATGDEMRDEEIARLREMTNAQRNYASEILRMCNELDRERDAKKVAVAALNGILSLDDIDLDTAIGFLSDLRTMLAS
jgi:hypothetical protein